MVLQATVIIYKVREVANDTKMSKVKKVAI